MKVAVIGAGASGLAALKTCLDYGFEPVCFEKTDDIGGLWKFKPHECPGQASVMKSTVINSSKDMTAFSDFPPPVSYPNFMHNTLLMEYFRAYAAHFELLPRIRFNTVVESITKGLNFEENGQWTVRHDGIAEVFDAVLICTGHHVDPYFPEFGSQEQFQGQIMHSHSYKDFHGFEGKSVCVVGIGNSGVDIAVELSRVCSKVYLSTRRGAWLGQKVGSGGYPSDLLYKTRWKSFLRGIWPDLTTYYEESQLNSRFSHANYGIQPLHRVSGAHPSESDELPVKILCGAVVVKPDIRKFTAHGLIFEDSSEVKIDAVILATGYSIRFPFLKDDVISVRDNGVSLYRKMFPPDLKPCTLAVLGLVQPLGSTISMTEMQCRLACAVLSGDVKLPSYLEMNEEITKDQDRIAARYVNTRRHTLMVDYIPYMDSLAEMLGVKPNPLTILLRDFDPRLAYAVLFHPCTPYQYRLKGPHKWFGARDALINMWDRVIVPTRTRTVTVNEDPKSGFFEGLFVLWSWFWVTVIGVLVLRLVLCVW